MIKDRRRTIVQYLKTRVGPDQRSNTNKAVNSEVKKETPEALIKDACIFATRGTPDGFKDAIEKLSKIEPQTIDTFYLRGNAHLKLGGSKHNEKAANDFTEAIHLSNKQNSPPSHLIAQLYYKRAYAYQMLGEYDQAIRDYSLFIRCANDKEDDLLARGFLSRGLVYETTQRMKKAFKDIDKAISLTHEKNPYYIYCRERVRIAINEIEEHEDDEHEDHDYTVRENGNDDQDVLRNSEKQRTIDPEMTFEKLFYDALLLSEQRKNKEALEKFINASKIATNNYQKADSLFRQGLCLYMLGERKEAQNTFEETLKLNPKHARAIFRLGIMQKEDNKLEEALKTLSSAYKYEQNHVDILHERANVYEDLGRLDESMYDRRRAMLLGQSSTSAILIIDDQIRHLKAEILERGQSIARHLKIGRLQEARHNFCNSITHCPEENEKLIKDTKYDDSMYKEAVNEYKMAIEMDTERLCPEAYALLGLCQEKKDFLQAHDIFQKLFQMFENSPNFKEMWTLFIKNSRELKYWNGMGAEFSERSMDKLKEIEETRAAIYNDEKSFHGNKNLLSFYRTCRVQLSNVLAAFALAGCNSEIITHNMKGSYSKVATILSYISKGMNHIPSIGSALSTIVGKGSEILEDKDHALIRNKLEMVSNCGDMIEQCNIARRVARRLTDRYKDQLTQLHLNRECRTNCWLWCVRKLPFIESVDKREPAERVAVFAVSYIISTVADKSIKKIRLKKANDKDALVEMLLELACRAHGPNSYVPNYVYDDPNQYLLITPKSNTDSLPQQQQLPPNENQNTTETVNPTMPIALTEPTAKSASPAIDEYFLLYEFFRAPGLLYDRQEDTKNENEDQQQQIPATSGHQENKEDQAKCVNHQQGNQPQSIDCLTSHAHQNTSQDQRPIDGEKWHGFPNMDAKHYGYRLCSSEEMKSMKEEQQNKKKSSICNLKFCCCTKYFTRM